MAISYWKISEEYKNVFREMNNHYVYPQNDLRNACTEDVNSDYRKIRFEIYLKERG